MINLLQTTHERLDIFVLNRKIDNIHAIYYFSQDIHTIVIFIRFSFLVSYRVDHLNLQFIPIILSLIGVYGIRHFGIANFVSIGSVCSILKGLAASEC